MQMILDMQTIKWRLTESFRNLEVLYEQLNSLESQEYFCTELQYWSNILIDLRDDSHSTNVILKRLILIKEELINAYIIHKNALTNCQQKVLIKVYNYLKEIK